MPLTTYLSRAVTQRIRVVAAQRGCTIRHILETAVEKFAESNTSPLPSERLSSNKRSYNFHHSKCQKITTSISAACRTHLAEIKKSYGIAINDSLERAVRWYLWDCPEARLERSYISNAYLPLANLSSKDYAATSSEMKRIEVPDLDEVKPGDSVLIDPSIFLLSLDRASPQSVQPRSEQAFILIYAAKNSQIHGYVTPFFVAELWQMLRNVRNDLTQGIPLVKSQLELNLDEVTERLHSLLSGPIKTIPYEPVDLESAIRLNQQGQMAPQLALSLASVLRVIGPGFIVASANLSHAPLARSSFCRLHVPSDYQ